MFTEIFLTNASWVQPVIMDIIDAISTLLGTGDDERKKLITYQEIIQ